MSRRRYKWLIWVNSKAQSCAEVCETLKEAQANRSDYGDFTVIEKVRIRGNLYEHERWVQ